MIDEIARNVARFCERESVSWEDLVALGVLDAEPEPLVAAMIELGRANCPGPLVAAVMGAKLLGEVAVVALTDASTENPRLFPWAQQSTRFVEIDGDHAYEMTAVDEVVPVETLGAEPWGRVLVERTAELGDATSALIAGDIARAAYLHGAGRRLVDAAAEHARTRKQFGRAIGSFQAVAHALADCAVSLSAAKALAWQAARTLDRKHAIAARLSAERAALRATRVTPQVFGGLGMMADGPVYPVSRRIRQLVSTPPVARAHLLLR